MSKEFLGRNRFHPLTVPVCRKTIFEKFGAETTFSVPQSIQKSQQEQKTKFPFSLLPRFIIRCNRLVTVSWKTLPLVSCHSVFKSHYESFQIGLTPAPPQPHPSNLKMYFAIFWLEVTPLPEIALQGCSQKLFFVQFLAVYLLMSLSLSLSLSCHSVFVLFFITVITDHSQGHLNSWPVKKCLAWSAASLRLLAAATIWPTAPAIWKTGAINNVFFYQDSVTFLQGIL